MTLIEINIPEEDGWRDDLASRVLLLMLAGVFLRVGIRLWAGVQPDGLIAAIPTFACYAIATQLTILVVADVDLAEHGRRIAYAITALLTVIVLATLWATGNSWINSLNTDALAFAHYSVDLLASGQNPMAASMAPATELEGAGEFWTRRVDGSKVLSWSYPGGILLAILPQWLAIGPGPIGIRLTSILVVAAMAAVMAYLLPAPYAVGGVLTLALPRNEWFTAAGGITDMYWALPLVVAMWLWATDRRLPAAALVGVACTMKQHPWAILPFLAVWVWQESPHPHAFARQAAQLIGIGAAVFLTLNLPFLLWNPSAWLTSAFTPVGGGGAPLVTEGAGLAVFHVAGLEIPRWIFKVAVVVVTGGSLVAYHHWFERLRWAAWVLPMAIFFVHYRSLASYFNWFVPVALIALVAAHGRLRGQTQEVTPV